MLAQIKVEGTAHLSVNELVCVCGKCLNNDNANARIEFNFAEQKIFYLCSKCKHMNEMFVGERKVAPLPKTRLGR